MYKITKRSKKMKNHYLLILSIFCCFSYAEITAQEKIQHKTDASEKILIKNGEDVLIEDFPYQADLGGCGGTIIGSTWIVTAEHCVGGIEGRTIGVGYTKRSDKSTGQTAVVKNVITFPCNSCDLSLLELESPLDLSGEYVKAIRYASADVFTEGYVQEGKECYATGWGQLDPISGESPDNLQGASLNFGVVSLSDTRIRVEETEGRLVCRGDSGGPLVVFNSDNSERILVGAVSGGVGTPCTDFGFWGNIANAASWIEEQTGIEPYKEDISLSVFDRTTNAIKINLWPVPANNVINISSEKEIKSIKIFDMSGKEVLQSDKLSQLNGTTSITLDLLTNGIYLLQDAESLSSSLFVVKK